MAETKNGLLALPAGDFNVARSLLMSGAPIIFLGPAKFAEHLKGLQHCRSLLLNVLFTQDIEANPQRMLSTLRTSES